MSAVQRLSCPLLVKWIEEDMDINVYHGLTWLLALGLPISGWFIVKSKRAIPSLLASFVVLAISGQHAGLAMLDGGWTEPRYMFGGIMFALGLLIWVITVSSFCREKEN